MVGPTFETGGPIFGRGPRNTPILLFEQPLKFIAHGHIFERLQYVRVVLLSAVHPSVPFLAFGHFLMAYDTVWFNRAVCLVDIKLTTPVMVWSHNTDSSFQDSHKNLGNRACTNSGYQVPFY